MKSWLEYLIVWINDSCEETLHDLELKWDEIQNEASLIGKVSKKARDESASSAPLKRGLFVTWVPAVHYYQGTLYPDFAEFLYLFLVVHNLRKNNIYFSFTQNAIVRWKTK